MRKVDEPNSRGFEDEMTHCIQKARHGDLQISNAQDNVDKLWLNVNSKCNRQTAWDYLSMIQVASIFIIRLYQQL